MQSFAFVIFGSMLFMNSAFAADNLISSHTTHPVLEALPSASSQASFQIAKTYYLPDYQYNLSGEGSYGKRVDRGSGNRTVSCASGGYYNAAKTPAGIIVYVSGNKKSVKVMNLGVVHSIDKYSINPDTPYQGAFWGIRAYPAGTLWKDIAAIPNIETGQPLIKAIKCGKYEF